MFDISPSIPFFAKKLIDYINCNEKRTAVILKIFAILIILMLFLYYYKLISSSVLYIAAIFICAFGLSAIVFQAFLYYGVPYLEISWLKIWFWCLKHQDSNDFIANTVSKSFIFVTEKLLGVDWNEPANEAREMIWNSIPNNAIIGIGRDFYTKNPEKFDNLSEQQKKFPLIIHRYDLDSKLLFGFYKIKLFSISLLTQSDITYKISDEDGQALWIDVNLPEQGLGIYNNAGKSWLSFLVEPKRLGRSEELLQEESNRMHRLVLNPDLEQVAQGSSLPPNFYLRWASAGALPIIKFNNEPNNLHSRWVALFFRDIPPIGWNIANGASESLNEQRGGDKERRGHEDIFKLGMREFCEEFIVTGPIFNENNELCNPINNYNFSLLDNFQVNPIQSIRFTREHSRIRKVVDEITLNRVVIPIQVTVIHNQNVAIKVGNSTGVNMIYSVNPFEQGIEITHVFSLQLSRNHRLLDGEFSLDRKILIRRPIALLNLGWLYEEWKNVQHRKNDDVKVLPNIPPESYIFYLDDIKLRQRRLRSLLEHNGFQTTRLLEICNEDSLITLHERLSEADKEICLNYIREQLPNLDDPVGRLRSRDVWAGIRHSSRFLYEYGPKFADYQQNKKDISDERLRTLCPVTWKSLDYLFAENNEGMFNEILR